ncbi:MAG: hypothetical protein K2X47_04335 [Bdellovibrionales bacterium]|nr:hypothetical protein [Bdellovibrionales bacterium]
MNGLITHVKVEPRNGISGYLHSILQFIPRQIGRYVLGNENFRFTPYQAAYNMTVRNPVRAGTTRFLGKSMDPTALVHFPVIMFLSMLMYAPIDYAYSQAMNQHVASQVSTYANQYDEAIQSDFRFRGVKKDLDRKAITIEEARREAYRISIAYTQYYKFRDSTEESRTLESELKLLDHFLFLQLKKVIKEGVKPAVGFVVPASAQGPLTVDQQIKLFDVTHLLYLKYHLISELEDTPPINKGDRISELKAEIWNEPFHQKLIQLKREGKISNVQRRLLLQEHAYWQTKFLEWQIIGVSKLQKVNGQYTQQTLTIDIIEEEMLASFQSGRP